MKETQKEEGNIVKQNGTNGKARKMENQIERQKQWKGGGERDKGER